MEGNISRCKELLRPSKEEAAEYLCFYLKEGIVTSVKYDVATWETPGIVISEIDNIKIGDKIPRFEHKGMRKGPFILSGKDKNEVSKLEKKIKYGLSISIDGKPGIMWD